MNEQEILYSIALTRVPHLSLSVQHVLVERSGSAASVFEHRRNIRDVIPDANVNVEEALAQMEQQLPCAEEEMAFVQKGKIQCLCYHDEAYPARLRECVDAPVILYYKGNANLNAAHVVSMVGTRQATDYGRDLCRHFVEDLAALCPETLVVSGLAYGVDIHCHRAALQFGLPTVGVLAHGLDQIYPRFHRDDAVRMVEQGGLLTEYMSKTNADKKNFVQRNRIVAGMSDATIVVESGAHGGSLITAGIAESYNREVFAFPGRVFDRYSEGCNNLISANKAALITSAESFVKMMGWATDEERKQRLAEGIQQEVFPELSDDERKIVEALGNSEGLQINAIASATGLGIAILSSLLFNLEMKGVIAMRSGGTYRLLK